MIRSPERIGWCPRFSLLKTEICEERVFVELWSKGCNSMLQSRTLTITALARKFGHSSGPSGLRRGYFRSVKSLNVVGTVT